MAVDLRKRHARGFDGPEDGCYAHAALMAGRGDPVNPMGGIGTGFTIAATLLSGLLVWGGVGFLADHLAGAPKPVFTAIGMVVGAVASIYLVWLRYGRGDGESNAILSWR